MKTNIFYNRMNGLKCDFARINVYNLQWMRMVSTVTQILIDYLLRWLIDNGSLYNIFPQMTEVFIAAVSTTKFELNEQDLQFYRDEKAKQIQEVRLAMQQLHAFDQLHKKERPLANHAVLWRNLLILSKILGYESEFAMIDQLRIPESILTQQLWALNQLFSIKHYYPRSPIGSWQVNADKYYILMEGIVEKEILRSSISKCDGETFQIGQARMNSSKFRKNNKKRFARTDEQIPICLNSKRSQGRNLQGGPSNFRSLTDVEMLEVNCSSWKRYVSDFKRLQEEYLMNFIRKKLNISLNFDLKEQKNQNSELSSGPFYSIIALQRKMQLQFTGFEIFLLYMGEMLITTPNYKVEISRGCVLNPATAQIFSESLAETKNIHGVAVSKSLSTVIKISIKKLQEYFKEVKQQKDSFIQMLTGLEANRRSKKQQQKIAHLGQAQSLGSLRPSKMIYKFNNAQTSQEPALRTISQSPIKLTQRPIGDITLKVRHRQKVIGLKSIENLVQKTAKAAELKHIQYLKKAHLSEDPNAKLHQQENSLLPEYIFKDCMRNIQTKNQLLKQAVKIQKEKMKNDMSKRYNQVSVDVPIEHPQKIKSFPSTDGSVFLKKRMKDIYVKTEGCEEMMIGLATSSERPTASASANSKTKTRQTVGSLMKLREFSEKQLYSGFFKWHTGGLGVMKKVQTGKIRRIKLK